MDHEPIPSPTVPDRPWTLAEVADFLREHERTTRRRIERGELHPIRLPGSRRLLFDPASILALLEITEVLAGGFSATETAERLGHADAAIIASTYGHGTASNLDAEAAK